MEQLVAGFDDEEEASLQVSCGDDHFLGFPSREHLREPGNLHFKLTVTLPSKKPPHKLSVGKRFGSEWCRLMDLEGGHWIFPDSKSIVHHVDTLGFLLVDTFLSHNEAVHWKWAGDKWSHAKAMTTVLPQKASKKQAKPLGSWQGESSSHGGSLEGSFAGDSEDNNLSDRGTSRQPRHKHAAALGSQMGVTQCGRGCRVSLTHVQSLGSS